MSQDRLYPRGLGTGVAAAESGTLMGDDIELALETAINEAMKYHPDGSVMHAVRVSVEIWRVE